MMVYIKNKEQNRFKRNVIIMSACVVSMEILIMMVQKYQAEKSEMRNDKIFFYYYIYFLLLWPAQTTHK